MRTNNSITYISGVVSSTFGYLAVGTSSVALSATSSNLGAEITGLGLDRSTGSVVLSTTSVLNDTYTLTKTFNVTGSTVIREIGWFSSVTGGTMLARQLTSVVAVNNGDTYKASFQIVTS